MLPGNSPLRLKLFGNFSCTFVLGLFVMGRIFNLLPLISWLSLSFDEIAHFVVKTTVRFYWSSVETGKVLKQCVLLYFYFNSQ